MVPGADFDKRTAQYSSLLFRQYHRRNQDQQYHRESCGFGRSLFLASVNDFDLPGKERAPAAKPVFALHLTYDDRPFIQSIDRHKQIFHRSLIHQ